MQKSTTDLNTIGIKVLALMCHYMIMSLTNSVLIVDRNICDPLQNDLMLGGIPTSFVDGNGWIPSALFQ